MFILALGLVPYSQSFVVPLGIDQSIIQILSIKPFFILRAMVPGLDATAKLPDSSAMTSCIYLDIPGHRLIRPYKSYASCQGDHQAVPLFRSLNPCKSRRSFPVPGDRPTHRGARPMSEGVMLSVLGLTGFLKSIT